ncbi:Hypothetical protein PHPALM_12579 [Phytophthora palmivora]|uniref:TKL protein kinase n=1 Tax=Phytophthora palmivora TaxID=4796 RepID=A0A2P4XZE4_9STRA|nr:Hypothetical protein PHPALM_12579 [Phytophthora palmivora]
MYLLPAKRAKYPRAFKWDDNMMHHFPKDFTLPVCPLLTMWTYWVCGDEIAKYPPFRILIASELEDVKTKRTLSSLRFVMLEIESRVLAQGAWVNNPSPRDAAEMLERLLSHVVNHLDEYLNTFSYHWTVSRACKAGLSRRGLEYLAARDPNWVDGDDAALVAVKKNFLHVLQWLNECYPDRTSWGNRQARCFMNIAAEKGHFEILQWLHTNRNEGCTTFALNIAASKGNLPMVQWLHQNRNEKCTKQAMDDAAENGHLAVVEWLHRNRSEGCSEIAMDVSAANGHLDVLRFLHENRREGCTSAALTMAATRGHLEVVKWLCTNRTEGQPATALCAAAESGHLAVTEYLYEVVRGRQRRSESTIRKAARSAMEAGHAAVAEQLEQKLKRQRLE